MHYRFIIHPFDACNIIVTFDLMIAWFHLLILFHFWHVFSSRLKSYTTIWSLLMQLLNNCWVAETVVKEDVVVAILKIYVQVQQKALTKIEFSYSFASLIRLQLISITSIVVSSLLILESPFYGLRFYIPFHTRFFGSFLSKV